MREKYTQVVDKFKSKLPMAERIITQRHDIVRTLMKKKKDLNTLLRVVAAEAQKYATSTMKVRESLEVALSSLNKLYEEIFVLKDDPMDTSE